MKGRNLSLTQQIIHFFVAVIIVYSITPVFPRIISNYLTTYFYLLVLVLCLLLVLVSRGSSSINEYVVLLIPFVLWKLIIYLTQKPSPIDWAYGTIIDFAPIVLGLFIVRRLGRESAKFFSIIIIISVAVTAVTTYIGLAEYPDAARYLATVANPNEALFVRYNMMNIGGYDFIYTAVLLYPVWIYAFKRGKIKPAWMVVIVIAQLLLTIQSGYTTAFLLFLLSSAFLFFNKDFKASYLIIVGIIAILLFFVLFDLMAQGIKSLADIIENKEISDRLKDIAGGREGLEESEDPRLELYMKSFNTFLASPLWGRLAAAGGGHSFFLDFLASYGILGAAILTVLYVIIFKRFYLGYRKTTGYGYVVWIFVQTLILSAVNPGMWLNVLCLFVPIILAFINKGEKPCESSLGSKLDTARS